MYNVISFQDTKHDSHCQWCPMYEMCLGSGNQNWTTFTTHSGKMSLQLLTTILNLGSHWVLYYSSLCICQQGKHLYGKALSKKIYMFPFEKKYFLSGNSSSRDHYIRLFCSSVIHGLNKQCGHSSQFSFWDIQIECPLEVLIITFCVQTNTPFFEQYFI